MIEIITAHGIAIEKVEYLEIVASVFGDYSACPVEASVWQKYYDVAQLVQVYDELGVLEMTLLNDKERRSW